MAMRGARQSTCWARRTLNYLAPMVVGYGQVVYYRSPCASAENGLTC